MTIILLLSRIMRMWNQTGNKWLYLSALDPSRVGDIGKWLNYSSNIYSLISLCCFSLILLWIVGILYSESQVEITGMKLTRLFEVTFTISILATFYYKLLFDIKLNLLLQWTSSFPKFHLWIARINFVCFFIMTSICILISLQYDKQFKDQNVVKIVKVQLTKWMITLVTLLVLLHKAHNLPLIIIMFIQNILLSIVLDNNEFQKYVLFLWMGKASYFMFGNSNSLSTIDISGAYTGLDDYNEIFVGIFTGLILLSGPILFFAGYFLTSTKSSTTDDFIRKCRAIMTISTSLLSWEILVFSILITSFRYHLFIWSVFSPKYIYEIFFNAFELVKGIVVSLSVVSLKQYTIK